MIEDLRTMSALIPPKPMSDIQIKNLAIRELINLLYVPETDQGYLNQTLRLGNIRKATVESGDNLDEWYSIVDIIGYAGYKCPDSNWRNVIKCYFNMPFYAPAWKDIKLTAEQRYLQPKFTPGIHGKTAMVSFKCAVSVLTRLPATSEAALADLSAIFAEHGKLLQEFSLPPANPS